MRLGFHVVLAFVILSVAANGCARAGHDFPTGATFEFSARASSDVVICQISLKTPQQQAPEYLDYRLVAEMDLHRGFIAHQFRLAVLQPAYQQTEFIRVPLRSAWVEGAGFRSDGKVGLSVQPNGEVWGTTVDPNTGLELLRAMVRPPFRIVFRRRGTWATRTYVIRAQVPQPALDAFSACVNDTLHPHL